jgi:hypothetical protein
MYKNKISAFILCAGLFLGIIPHTGFAQEKPGIVDFEPAYTVRKPDRPKILDKFFVGGGLGLQFGNQTLIDVSPMIGYSPVKNLGIGINPTYKYYHFKGYSSSYPTSTSNIFGVGFFVQYDIIRNILAHAEYEYLHYSTKVTGSLDRSSIEVSSLFVGGGYRQPISEKASMYLLVLWNLNDDLNSPYTNPVIRAGIKIGL